MLGADVSQARRTCAVALLVSRSDQRPTGRRASARPRGAAARRER